MKRLIKKLVRPLWRMTSSIRRPVVRKFDQHVMELLRPFNRTVEPPADLELVLNSVVRELARLQIQVEILQQQIDDLQSSDRDGEHSESRLLVVGEIG